MRRAVFALLVSLTSIFLGAAGHAPAPQLTQFSDEQKAALDRVSGYLNQIRTLKGEFSQIDPDGGIEQGDVYIEKPGKMRFDYRPPSSVLIVSDGDTVAIRNGRLNTLDRYSLSDTPLSLILGDNIDLKHNRSVTGVDMRDGAITIRARSASTKTQGDIAITFAEQPLELRQWVVLDAQRLSTTVALRNIQTGGALPSSLFVLKDLSNPLMRK
jgi:outer membrane lipoprotein-sorting protein